MKKLITALALAAIAMTTMAAGCSAPRANVEHKAINVETVEITTPHGVGTFYVFDLERDGQTLTCTTTDSLYQSGVNCTPKETKE